MPSENAVQRLPDIIENAEAILLISEGAAKLGDQAATLMPDQPWQEIRSLGNRLRHEYDAIREDRLWDIIQADLSPLRAACEDALRRLRETPGL